MGDREDTRLRVALRLEDDLDALVVHLRFPAEHRQRIPIDEPARAHLRRSEAHDKGDRPLPGETSALCLIWAGARARQPRLARRNHEPKGVAEIERLRRALAAGETLPENDVHQDVIAA